MNAPPPFHQTLSPFFGLPAELRIQIYASLQFPPISHCETFGFILSCRKAKREAEEAAIKNVKTFLTNFKQSFQSETATNNNDIRKRPYTNLKIIINLPTPIAPRCQFHTLREITIVLPPESYESIYTHGGRILNTLQYLDPIFKLRLSKLTLHVQDLDQIDNLTYKRMRHIQHIMTKGFRCAHDPKYAETFIPIYKYRSAYNIWKPPKCQVKKFLVSWNKRDIDWYGENNGGMMRMKGWLRGQCEGRLFYAVGSGDCMMGDIGEIGQGGDRKFCWMPGGHVCDKDKLCWKCEGSWEYVKYARETLRNGDQRLYI